MHKKTPTLSKPMMKEHISWLKEMPNEKMMTASKKMMADKNTYHKKMK